MPIVFTKLCLLIVQRNHYEFEKQFSKTRQLNICTFDVRAIIPSPLHILSSPLRCLKSRWEQAALKIPAEASNIH